MALPQIQYPDISNGLAAAGKGYALGQDMRAQNTLSQAGAALAAGDRKGATNALYAGGQVEQGLKMEEHFRQQARQASADQLAKAQRFNATLGNLALSADTPEKWAAAIGAAKQAGMDVDKWADFGTRDYVLAQAGKTKEMLEMALKERQKDEELQIKRDAIAAKTAAASRPKPRTLSFNDTQKLAEKGVQMENVDRYATTFKPDYAGYGRGGEKAMWIARNLPILTGPTTEKAAGWWQDYDRYKNVVRNELFGSALTASEQEAFEKSDITPNMDPAAIKQNLQRQQAAIRSALGKTAKSLTAGGYSQEAVEGAIGVPLDRLGVQSPAAATTPAQSGDELDESGLGDLPDGAIIRDESGVRYQKQGNQFIEVE